MDRLELPVLTDIERARFMAKWHLHTSQSKGQVIIMDDAPLQPTASFVRSCVNTQVRNVNIAALAMDAIQHLNEDTTASAHDKGFAMNFIGLLACLADATTRQAEIAERAYDSQAAVRRVI